MKLARGSYANVTATLALLVALGGTSYAAVEIAKNSVGTPQLKANAVTAKKVKDGSLLSRDFKAGQLPGGPQGPAGAAGAAGAIGPNGPVGATGQQGLVGARGPAGTEGAHGDQGLQGEKGDTGDQGIQGAQGDTGEKGDQGDRGVQGAQGDKGEKGDPGPAGPLLTMLPSGKTLVGHWGVHEQDVNNTASSSISYFAPLASNPQSEIVAFGDGPTENCPGSAAAPSAEAGFLCVYEGTNTGAPVIVITGSDGSGGDLRYGAQVVVLGSGIVTTAGTWAVTAP